MDRWVEMRKALWPDEDRADLREQAERIIGDAAQGTFVAARCDDGALIGFAEASLHPHAIGCTSTPIGYLEGWWVDAQHRRSGVGAQLVAACEAWARAQGCREMASDALLENMVSDQAHRRLGYAEAGRLIHYAKML